MLFASPTAAAAASVCSPDGSSTASSATASPAVVDRARRDTVEGDTVQERAPERVGEEIPAYRTTLRYLRSLRPLADSAIPDTGQADVTGPGLDLDLVINETRTPTGQDFFDAFYARWEAPEGVRSYTLRIQEQPVPGAGLYTRVVLRLEGEQLVQIPLQPRRAYIEEVARQAVNYVREEMRQSLGSDPAARPAGQGGGASSSGGGPSR